MRREGTKLGEEGRDLEGERAFREYYVQEYYTNPDSGRLRSGLLHLGKVCGALKSLAMDKQSN